MTITFVFGETTKICVCCWNCFTPGNNRVLTILKEIRKGTWTSMSGTSGAFVVSRKVVFHADPQEMVVECERILMVEAFAPWGYPFPLHSIISVHMCTRVSYFHDAEGQPICDCIVHDFEIRRSNSRQNVSEMEKKTWTRNLSRSKQISVLDFGLFSRGAVHGWIRGQRTALICKVFNIHWPFLAHGPKYHLETSHAREKWLKNCSQHACFGFWKSPQMCNAIY